MFGLRKSASWVRGIEYVKVDGSSMTPVLDEGDWVVALRGWDVDAGDVVLLEDPEHPGRVLVKRIALVEPDGYWVLGDASEASRDSRQFGTVPEVLGKVVWRIRPWGPVG